MTNADFPPKKLMLRAIILPPLPPSANQPLLASSPSNQLLEGVELPPARGIERLRVRFFFMRSSSSIIFSSTILSPISMATTTTTSFRRRRPRRSPP